MDTCRGLEQMSIMLRYLAPHLVDIGYNILSLRSPRLTSPLHLPSAVNVFECASMASSAHRRASDQETVIHQTEVGNDEWRK